jgi:hypothetical protein
VALSERDSSWSQCDHTVLTQFPFGFVRVATAIVPGHINPVGVGARLFLPVDLQADLLDRDFGCI